MPDTVAAPISLAEQLEAGGPRSVHAAAANLGIHADQVRWWLERWRQAVRGPQASTVRARRQDRRN